ncbi:hypothetical protein NHX12_019728 [Muraenolepis orangiensis]|uniref:Uncharacterized protein n=1 Tax=Muraenolepis orangiensis TaxID=630683 RepID=A0A9Q0IWB7_9TELE|nr:hypothetical protein NHX12_019728 [Muraenolepis orangiensis]
MSRSLGRESPAAPCQAADLPRWDKLFIALEDSHMRQNMLLDALEQLAKGACRREGAEILAEMREEGAAGGRRTHAALQRLLEGSREPAAGLRRLEESDARRLEESDARRLEESDARRLEESDARRLEESDARRLEERPAGGWRDGRNRDTSAPEDDDEAEADGSG